MPFYEDPNTSALEPVEVVGNVAAAATDSGNPVKVGAVYKSTAPTYTDGQRTDLQSDPRGRLKVVVGNGATNVDVTTPADATSNSNAALIVDSFNAVFNGSSWDRQRTAAVFKAVSVAITAGSPQTVWTPTSGKKFRLMGYSLSGSSGGTILFYDGTGGSTLIWRAPKGASNGLNFAPPNLGNGYLSVQANNVLQIDSDTSSTFTGFVFGTEE